MSIESWRWWKVKKFAERFRISMRGAGGRRERCEGSGSSLGIGKSKR